MMGLWAWMRGQRNGQVADRVVGRDCKRTVAVVGEYYRGGAAQVIGSAERCDFLASLVPEPRNAHDPNAVKVIVGKVHVGYLSRAHAKTYQPVVQLAAAHGERIAVRGYGYRHGQAGNTGHEIVLYLPSVKKLSEELRLAYGE